MVPVFSKQGDYLGYFRQHVSGEVYRAAYIGPDDRIHVIELRKKEMVLMRRHARSFLRVEHEVLELDDVSNFDLLRQAGLVLVNIHNPFLKDAAEWAGTVMGANLNTVQ